LPIKLRQMRPRSRLLIRKIRNSPPRRLLLLLPRRLGRITHLLLPNQLTGLQQRKLMPKLLWTWLN